MVILRRPFILENSSRIQLRSNPSRIKWSSVAGQFVVIRDDDEFETAFFLIRPFIPAVSVVFYLPHFPHPLQPSSRICVLICSDSSKLASRIKSSLLGTATSTSWSGFFIKSPMPGPVEQFEPFSWDCINCVCRSDVPLPLRI